MKCVVSLYDPDSGRAVRHALSAPSGRHGRDLLALLSAEYGVDSWTVEDRDLADLVVGSAPLVEGCTIVPGSAAARGKPLFLTTLAGPDCGRVFSLDRSVHSLGKDRTDICLDDPALRPLEGVLEIDGAGALFRPQAGAGRRVELEEPFVLGATSMVLSTEPATGPVRGGAAGVQAPEPVPLDLEPSGSGLLALLVSAGTPLVGGLAVAWLFHTWMLLVFAGVGSLAACAHWLLRGSAAARNRRALTVARELDARRWEEVLPPLGRQVASGSPGRAPAAPGPVWVRWGTGRRGLHARVSGSDRGRDVLADGMPVVTSLSCPHRCPDQENLLDAVIAQILLQGRGIVLLAGSSPADPVAALYDRWQAVPRVRLATAPDQLGPAEPSTEVLVVTEDREHDVAGWSARLVIRRSRPAGAAGSVQSPPGPAHPGQVLVAEDRPGVLSVTAEDVGEAVPGLPREGRIECWFPDRLGRQGRLELVQNLVLRADAEDGGTVPRRLSARPEFSTDTVDRRWQASAAQDELWVDSGVDPTTGAALRWDLNAWGPHLLVAGTTGSGKSEYLRSVLAVMALTYSPMRLAMVLIDFKGGTSFGPLAGLPHVQAVVTDLDEHAVRRSLAYLLAELRRREERLHRLGLASWSEWMHRQAEGQASADQEPMPEMVVCVDEFRMLVDSFPQVMQQLLRIATIGRSLGVHLILSTQRPQGAVSQDIRANMSLSVCLRVAAEADSVNVIGVPDAARIPVSAPGRGILRSEDRTVAFAGLEADGFPAGQDPRVVLETAHGVRRVLAADHEAAPSWAEADAASTGAKGLSQGLSQGVEELTRRARDAGCGPGQLPALVPPVPGTGGHLVSDRHASSRDGWTKGDASEHRTHLGTGEAGSPAGGGGLWLGVAECPSLGRQEGVWWEPAAHGPLEVRGTGPAEHHSILTWTETACRRGIPVYAAVADPALASALEALGAPGMPGVPRHEIPAPGLGRGLPGGLRAVASPEDPAHCEDVIRFLAERALAGIPSTGPDPLVVLQGLDQIMEELGRHGVRIEPWVQSIAAASGRSWWILLSGTRNLPRPLQALVGSRVHAGPAAREEYRLLHHRADEDLVEELQVLEGELVPAGRPWGLAPSLPQHRASLPYGAALPHSASPIEEAPALADARSARADSEPAPAASGSAEIGSVQPAASAWPVLTPLPQRLVWEPAEAWAGSEVDPGPDARGIRLLVGQQAPEPMPLVLELVRGQVLPVIGAGSAGADDLVEALRELNPHAEVRLHRPPEHTASAVPGIAGRTDPSLSARPPVPALEEPVVIGGPRPFRVEVVLDLHAWPAAQHPRITRWLEGADAGVLTYDPSRFLPARSPWARQLVDSPTAVVMGPRTGSEVDFRHQSVTGTRGPVPRSTGVLVTTEATTRFRIARAAAEGPRPREDQSVVVRECGSASAFAASSLSAAPGPSR